MKFMALLYAAFLATAIVCGHTIPNDTATPIKHLIVIVQENHSFDNYFGTYPTANGTLNGTLAAQLQSVEGFPRGVCIPYASSCLSPYHANSGVTQNPIEGQFVYERDVDDGKMDGFAKYSGPQSLSYFDQNQIASYWSYAEEYGLADNYFSAVISTTNANRLLLLAGDTPVAENNGPPPYLPYNHTILYQLSTADVSWSYFDFFSAEGTRRLIPPINYLADVDPASLAQFQDMPLFLRALNENQLPSVSFINAIGFDTLDEHPPSNVTLGEQWVVSIVNAVMRSSYWSSAAILITYDEAGGFYDHVPPPQIITIDHDFDRALRGYGERVPLLVISPFAKENFVSNILLNHMSILRFIDYNWNLPALNQNVENSNNLLDFFYFETSRPPISLAANSTYPENAFPIPLQIPLSALPYSRSSFRSAESGTTWNADKMIAPAGSIVIVVVAALLLYVLFVHRKSRALRQRTH